MLMTSVFCKLHYCPLTLLVIGIPHTRTWVRLFMCQIVQPSGSKRWYGWFSSVVSVCSRSQSVIRCCRSYGSTVCAPEAAPLRAVLILCSNCYHRGKINWTPRSVVKTRQFEGVGSSIERTVKKLTVTRCRETKPAQYWFLVTSIWYFRWVCSLKLLKMPPSLVLITTSPPSVCLM